MMDTVVMPQNLNKMRTFLAVILSPLLASLAFFVGVLPNAISKGANIQYIASGLLQSIVFVTPIALVGLLVIGIPILLLLRANGKASYKLVVPCGALFGTVIMLILATWRTENQIISTLSKPGVLQLLGLGALCGAVVAASFLVIGGITWRSRLTSGTLRDPEAT